jgi:LPXTG-motif cell wall-anchored protein
MTRLHLPRGLAVAGLLLLLAALPASALAQSDTLTVTLSPQNGSGISGTATFTDMGNGKTHVVIQTSGAGPGPEPAHIHPGSCAQLDPTPAFTLSSVVNGMSATDVDSTLQQLIDGHYAIHMHKSQDELTVYVACGDVLRTGQPRALPNTGTAADDWTGALIVALGLGLVTLGLLSRRRAVRL